MPVAQRIAVRNLMKGPTVMSLDPNNVKNYIMWEGAGDPKGNDIKFISRRASETPEFQQALKRRIVALVDDEDAVDRAMDLQTEAWNKRQDEAVEKIERTIEHQPKNELVALECLATGPSGRICGTTVMMREGKTEIEPPLCDVHAYQIPDFERRQQDENGKLVMRWVKQR